MKDNRESGDSETINMSGEANVDQTKRTISKMS